MGNSHSRRRKISAPPALLGQHFALHPWGCNGKVHGDGKQSVQSGGAGEQHEWVRIASFPEGAAVK